jgi:hypothetical protein
MCSKGVEPTTPGLESPEWLGEAEGAGAAPAGFKVKVRDKIFRLHSLLWQEYVSVFSIIKTRCEKGTSAAF